MRISEVAAKSGLSIDTIRYYEKSGLCPPIARGRDGTRQFTAENAEWLALLSSLRDTGMPTKDMRHFAGLYQTGDATIPERKHLLLEHSRRLEARHETINRCKALLAHKLARYDRILGQSS